MGRTPLRIDAQLEASLRRIAGALERSRLQYAATVEDILAATGAALDDGAEPSGEPGSRVAERHRRRAEQKRRRRERQRERVRDGEEPDEAELPKGIVFAIAAIACLIFVLYQPQEFFWMLFVALGFGISAATLIGRAASRRRLQREADAMGERATEAERVEARSDEPAVPVTPTSSAPSDPKVARIRLLCDKLLAELESGPAIVREVVTDPRSTIAGLRQACVETARRESELRVVLAAQDESALQAERDALATRLSSEQDPIVRDRLAQALAALEQQLVHRAALATVASRLEAENMRILYTVESLHMQLLRARSTDMGAPELGVKLRDSLRELGIQIEALAEALELADAPALADTATSQSGVPRGGDAAQQVDAERAEREAASRRAARAQEAQRH
jgi:hypothetical protein